MGRRKIEDCSIDELFKMVETLERELSILESAHEIGLLHRNKTSQQKNVKEREAELKETKFYCRRILREKLLRQQRSPYTTGKNMLNSEGFKKDVYREVFVYSLLEKPSPLPVELIDEIVAELHIDELACLAETFQNSFLGEKCHLQLKKTEALLYAEFEEMLDSEEIQATLRRQQIGVVPAPLQETLDKEESQMKPSFLTNHDLGKAQRQKRLQMNRQYKNSRKEE